MAKPRPTPKAQPAQDAKARKARTVEDDPVELDEGHKLNTGGKGGVEMDDFSEGAADRVRDLADAGIDLGGKIPEVASPDLTSTGLEKTLGEVGMPGISETAISSGNPFRNIETIPSGDDALARDTLIRGGHYSKEQVAQMNGKDLARALERDWEKTRDRAIDMRREQLAGTDDPNATYTENDADKDRDDEPDVVPQPSSAPEDQPVLGDYPEEQPTDAADPGADDDDGTTVAESGVEPGGGETDPEGEARAREAIQNQQDSVEHALTDGSVHGQRYGTPVMKERDWQPDNYRDIHKGGDPDGEGSSPRTGALIIDPESAPPGSSTDGTTQPTDEAPAEIGQPAVNVLKGFRGGSGGGNPLPGTGGVDDPTDLGGGRYGVHGGGPVNPVADGGFGTGSAVGAEPGPAGSTFAGGGEAVADLSTDGGAEFAFDAPTADQDDGGFGAPTGDGMVGDGMVGDGAVGNEADGGGDDGGGAEGPGFVDA